MLCSYGGATQMVKDHGAFEYREFKPAIPKIRNKAKIL